MAALLARDAPAELAAPVPWRLLRRGFNQAQVLARGLKKHHGLDVAPRLLRRLRHTRPQVGLPPPRERAANVAGAFGVNPRLAHLAQGRRVLLLSDVLTTGATVGECASVLIAAAAAEVAVLTLTRVGVPGAGRASRGGSGDAAANSELARSR